MFEGKSLSDLWFPERKGDGNSRPALHKIEAHQVTAGGGAIRRSISFWYLGRLWKTTVYSLPGEDPRPEMARALEIEYRRAEMLSR